MANKTVTLRYDYSELSELTVTLLLLGGTLGKGITIKATEFLIFDFVTIIFKKIINTAVTG